MLNAGLTLPLPLTANSLLKDADPIRHTVLHYTAAALTADLQARWAASAAQAGLPVEEQNIIGSKTHIRIFNYAIDQTVKFPLLVVNRGGTAYSKAASSNTTTAQFQITFVLPPLSASQAYQLEPILHAVEQSVFYRATENPFLAANGIRSITVASRDSVYDNFELPGDKVYPAITMFLEVTSNIIPTQNLNLKPLDGVDITYEEASTDDPIVMVQTSNNFPQEP